MKKVVVFPLGKSQLKVMSVLTKHHYIDIKTLKKLVNLRSDVFKNVLRSLERKGLINISNDVISCKIQYLVDYKRVGKNMYKVYIYVK